MSYFILEIPSISYYDFHALWHILRSSNLTSVIKQFNISRIFLLVRSYSIYTHYMKNFAKYLFLLNNKQDLKSYLNEI